MEKRDQANKNFDNIYKGYPTDTTQRKKRQKNLLKEEDIAEALAERNLLRLTHTTQISANRQFLAITFQNTQIMEKFCTELLLVRDSNITFRPKKDFPKKRKTMLNISFLNIPAETPDEPLTEYLSQFPDIVGNPLHTQRDHHGIPYYTSTRVYQVNRLYQHIPRHIKDMFARSVLCIYDNQPTDQPRPRNNTPKSENYNNSEQQIGNNNRKTLQLENLNLHQQHNTRLTKNHHQQLPGNSKGKNS